MKNVKKNKKDFRQKKDKIICLIKAADVTFESFLVKL